MVLDKHAPIKSRKLVKDNNLSERLDYKPATVVEINNKIQKTIKPQSGCNVIGVL